MVKLVLKGRQTKTFGYSEPPVARYNLTLTMRRYGREGQDLPAALVIAPSMKDTGQFLTRDPYEIRVQLTFGKISSKKLSFSGLHIPILDMYNLASVVVAGSESQVLGDKDIPRNIIQRASLDSHNPVVVLFIEGVKQSQMVATMVMDRSNKFHVASVKRVMSPCGGIRHDLYSAETMVDGQPTALTPHTIIPTSEGKLRKAEITLVSHVDECAQAVANIRSSDKETSLTGLRTLMTMALEGHEAAMDALANIIFDREISQILRNRIIGAFVNSPEFIQHYKERIGRLVSSGAKDFINADLVDQCRAMVE